MKKQITFKTKGMNRDLSVSAFNPEFCFENMNLRLSTNESNTLMSWVNEKGTDEFSLNIDTAPWVEGSNRLDGSGNDRYIDTSIIGTPIGSAVLNHQIVLFTTNPNEGGLSRQIDRIYVLKQDSSNELQLTGKIIYRGFLNFNVSCPLEAIVSFESNTIQKVYFNDGRNQPRLINIAVSNDELKKWQDELNDRTSSLRTSDYIFDFTPSTNLKETFSVSWDDTKSGIFAAGVMQYCFTYSNKNGQETSLISTSPLISITEGGLGVSPEESASGAFSIQITNIDNTYDSINIYSIQRTSLNGVPYARHLGPFTLTGIKVTQEIITKSSTEPLLCAYELERTQGGDIRYLYGAIVENAIIEQETVYGEDRNLNFGYTDGTTFTPVISVTDFLHTFENGNPKYYDNDDVIITDYFVKISLNKLFNDYIKPAASISATYFCYKAGDYAVYNITALSEENTPKVWYYSLPHKKWDIEWNSTEESVVPSFSLIDNGTLGSTIDPESLLYKNKIEVLASSMCEKDNTLFLGNLTTKNASVEHIQNFFDLIRASDASYTPVSFETKSKSTSPTYRQNLKDLVKRETYRFGIRLQTKTGEWTEPIWIKDYKVEDKDRNGNVLNGRVYASTNINLEELNNYLNTTYDESFDLKYYKKIRPVIVYPTLPEREVICQGILNTVMFNMEDRDTNSPYAWPDWGLRRYDAHFRKVWSDKYTDPYHKYGVSGASSDTGFFADQSLLTMYSPDIEFDEALQAYSMDNVKLRIVGMLNWNSRVYYDYSTYDERDIYGGGSTEPTDRSVTQYNGNTYIDDDDDFSYEWPYLGKRYDSYGNIDYDLLTKKVGYNIGDTRRSIFYEFGVSPSVKIINPEDEVVSIEQKIDYNVSSYATRSRIYYPKMDSAFVTQGEYPHTTGIKYKSNWHALIALNCDEEGKIYLPPHKSDLPGYYPQGEPDKTQAPDWLKEINLAQEAITGWTSSYHGPFIGELYREVENKFGGTSTLALKNNEWLSCGEEKALPNYLRNNYTIDWTDGDAYYETYNMLTVYGELEDKSTQNLIIATVLTSRINPKCRYNKNIGNLTTVKPDTLNKMNPVYNQQDNFFVGRMVSLGENISNIMNYPNLIWYSLTKESGADIDSYTNIVLSSVLDLDGNKGEITSLQKYNNQLLCFQDSAISQILFNETVQISSQQGVPIEIANSGKVQGKRYLSNTVGCSNKWSVVQTPNGLYFMDSNDKSIYLFNGQLNNISQVGGFNTWCKQNISSQDKKWTPEFFETNGKSPFRGFYDKLNQDVLFVNKNTALAWSEKFQTFTSFYDYGNTPYFENLDDVGTWIRSNGSIWKHQAGNYCQFFDTNKPYWMTLIGNPESQMDKIFTNLEFRACVDGDGTVTDDKFTPTLPFDSLEAWNEYQHGETTLGIKSGHDLFKHGDNSSALIRKYRIWRCDIPRDNFDFMTYPVQEQEEAEADYQARVAAYNEWLKGEQDKGIYRTGRHFNDRMRNPWLYLNLMKKVPSSGVLPRTEIHDVVMTYFD